MSKATDVTRMFLSAEKKQLLAVAVNASTTPEERAECETRIAEINTYIAENLS